MNCADCRYWVLLPEYDTVGVCHRYPLESDGSRVAPPHDDWCGEHRPQGEEEHE